MHFIGTIGKTQRARLCIHARQPRILADAAAAMRLDRIVDDAIQAFGGAGVTEDPGLARMYAQSRTLRLVDGPDEVHNRSIARMEIARHGNFTPMKTH